MEQQEFTHGQKLAGIAFSVGNDPQVHECKQRFADAIDQLEQCHVDSFKHGTLTTNKEMIIAEAQKRILDAQMWAVKALTYGK